MTFSIVKKKIQRALFDVNILLSKKQTVHVQGYFIPENGMTIRRMTIQDDL